jgi:hypothetical protein
MAATLDVIQSKSRLLGAMECCTLATTAFEVSLILVKKLPATPLIEELLVAGAVDTPLTDELEGGDASACVSCVGVGRAGVGLESSTTVGSWRSIGPRVGNPWVSAIEERRSRT